MLIVWDYFGVLAQDSFWYTAARIAEDMSTGGHMHDLHIDADLGRISWDTYCNEVAHDIGVDVETVRERYQHHRIKRDVVHTIRELQGAHSQVLLSNASHEYLLPIMKRLGLDIMFDDIFVSSQIGYAKPDTRAFEYVLSAMNHTPDNSVMIDDSPHNIDAARSLGMRGILFTDGHNALSQLKTLTTNQS